MNSDGTVDWDEITDYLFLSRQESSPSEEAISYTSHGRKWNPTAVGPFTKLMRNPVFQQGAQGIDDTLNVDKLTTQGQLVAVSRGGTVIWFDPASPRVRRKQQLTFPTREANLLGRGSNALHIQDAALSDAGIVCCASMNFGMTFFDAQERPVTRGGYIGRLPANDLRHQVPLCLDVATHPVFATGDTGRRR